MNDIEMNQDELSYNDEVFSGALDEETPEPMDHWDIDDFSDIIADDY